MALAAKRAERPDAGARWLLGAGSFFGVLAFGLAVTLLAVRNRLSLDLTDESYYAVFIDDWLKGGLRTSTLSTLHETAALVVYPFSILFDRISGSTDGLFLFLRYIYLVISCVMALVWWRFMRAAGLSRTAWPLAIAAVGFVPFGLPAPSYNTLGMQGVTIALAAYGIAQMRAAGRSGPDRVWLLVSAIAAAIATVAYPPLTAFVLAFGFLTLFTKGSGLGGKARFLGALAAIFALAWACVIAALTWRGLVDSFVNVALLNNAGNLWRKIAFTFDLLRGHKPFTLMLAAATLLGLFRPRVPFWAAFGLLLVLTIGCFQWYPTLFVRSHDVITIWSATGLWLLRGFRPRAPSEERLVALLYASSLVSGAITAASATWSPYNFCIGAFPAALLALAYGFRGPELRNIFATSTLAATVLWLGFSDHFLTDPNEPQAKIDWGFFAGVSAPRPKIELLEYMRDRVAPLTEPDRTILVLGRLPGLALATPARPLAIWVWPLAPDVSPQSPEYLRQFYVRDAAHRPKIVAIYKDALLDPVNPMGASFPEWYREVEHKNFNGSEITIFERK